MGRYLWIRRVSRDNEALSGGTGDEDGEGVGFNLAGTKKGGRAVARPPGGREPIGSYCGVPAAATGSGAGFAFGLRMR
jgi:hypothetical protein